VRLEVSSTRWCALLGAILVCGAVLLFAAQGASAQTYEEAVEGTSGLSHFWPMDESSGSSFEDAVGGANAETSGGVSLGEPGGLSEAATSALFDGTSGAAQAKVDLSGTHELTIEFWMKWHAYGEDDRLALEFTPNFNHNAGGFLVDPDATPGSDFAVAIGDEGNYNNIKFERPSAEAWHYYAFVIDTAESAETEITPYIDGHVVSYTKVDTSTVTGNFANDTLFWMSRDASTLFGQGSMQDLALYDTKLSSSTVLEHYAIGASRPAAAFSSSPVVATAGVPVHFNASESSSPNGSIADYAWDFDGSKTYATDGGSTATTSHTFPSAGTYTVDLRVKDGTGATGTVSRTVTVGAALGSYEKAVEETSDISHFWPMGESSGSSFADVVGGADAASTGGVSLGEPGGLVEDSSTSAAFDGTSGAAQAPVNLSGTHKLTIEFWMKWHAYGADDRLAMEFTPNFNSYTGGFLVDPDATPGSDFAVAVGKGGTANTVFFTRPSAEQWHYYSFVIDTEAAGEAEIKPYVDGKTVSYTKSSSNGGAGAFASSTLFWMSRNASELFGAGSMQDLALYEDDLSSETILEHYALGEHGPKATFTSSPAVATAGVPVHFDASGSTSPTGPVSDYAWDFNGSKSYASDGGSTATISHIFSSPGTYTVDLQVEDSLGEKATVSKTIVVGAALGQYEQAVEGTSGIAHFWPMNESSGSTFADAVGGTDATTSGGTTLGEPGGLVEDLSTSTAFDGTSGAAQANVDLSGTTKLTVEFWMKWHAYGEDDHLALEFTPNFNEHPGGFLVDPDATPGSDFAVALGRGYENHNNNVLFERPSAEHWHYYAFVIDTEASGETEITPYVDGHAVSYTKPHSETGAGHFAYSTLNWMSRNSTELFGAGSMQDLALYESDLSAEAVLEHYERGENTYKPTNTTAPSIEGTPQDGQTLTANPGSWSGSEPITYTYQWQSCNSSGASCSNISGATGSTYVVGHGDVGRTVKVVVTATHGGASAPATSSASAVIASLPAAFLYSSQFGTEGSGEGQFEHPAGVAVDSGHIWVLDRGDNRVEEFGEGGGYLRSFGSYGSGEGQLAEPDGIAVNGEGHVLVADTGNERVEEFGGDGEYLQSIGSGTIGADEGVTVDSDGDVWVSNTGAGDLVVFSAAGEYLNTVGSGHIGEPEGLAADAKGDVFVADWSNDRVEEFNEEGAFVQQFGTEGSGEGQVSQPYGIAVGSDGNVFVGEIGNDRVQQFNESGEYISELGSPGSGPGELNLGYPTGLAVDAKGDVLVADSNNNRVERWAPEVTGPPTNTEAPIIEGTIQEGEPLTTDAGMWSGSTPFSYAYQWERCNSSGESCASISGATSAIYTPISGDLGHTLRAVVTATNGLGSASSSSAATGVVSQAPTNTVLPSISGAAQDGETLTASTGTWEGSSPLTYTYQWQSCDSLGMSCLNITEATTSTYSVAGTDAGSTVDVVVTASNAAGSVDATSAATSSVSVEAGGTGAPSIEGFPNEGETLYANAGAWGEASEAVQLSYQWEHCNASGEECDDIEEATTPRYELGEGDVGSTLRVLIGATSQAGSISITTATTSVIGAPRTLANGSPPTVSGTPQKGLTLTAAHGEWTGEGTISYAYQWQSCEADGSDCAEIEGATTSSYTLLESDVGQAVRVLVTATDANGSLAEPSAATQPIAAASAPTISEAPALTGEAQEGKTLTATMGSWSAEGSLTYSLQWERCDEESFNCTAISGATSTTYELSKQDVGSTIRALVTATAGGASTTALSAAVGPVSLATLVNNSAPTISGATRAGDILTAAHGIWTGSGTITYSYQWQKCNAQGASCATIGGATSSTYNSTTGEIGDTLRALVTATSTWGHATAPSDVTATILAQPPVNLTTPSIKGSPIEGELLTAERGTWSGGEPISYSYQWQRCNTSHEDCTNISGATHTTYLLTSEDLSTTLQVEITATNAGGEATQTATLSGSPVSEPEVSPERTTEDWVEGTATNGTTVTAEPGTWRGTKPITFSYQWQRCNEEHEACVNISGASGKSYGVGEADLGSTLQVEVTATNSVGSATEVIWLYGVVGEPLPPEPEEPPVSVLPATISGESVDGWILQAEPGTWAGSVSGYTYQWERCNEAGEECSPITGATEGTYILNDADLGFTLRQTTTATNSFGSTTSTSAATSVIAAGAPVGEVPFTRSPGNGEYPGELLEARNVVARGAGPITESYQWQRCDESGESCTDISGATGTSYTILEEDVSSTIRVTVAYSNTHGTDTEHSTPSLLISDHAPINTSKPTLSWSGIGLGVEGTVTGSNGEWAGSEPITYEYQWQSCHSGSICENISGATAATYTTTSTGEVRLKVTASNSHGSTSANSLATTVFENGQPPHLVTEPTISGTAISGETLTVTSGEWHGEPTGYTYKWETCDERQDRCNTISGATTNTLALSTDDEGIFIRADVTATNAHGSRSTISKATTRVAATPPLNIEPPSISGEDIVGNSLEATHGTWLNNTSTLNPEGEYKYQWQLCSSSGGECSDIPGDAARQSHYSPPGTDVGSTVRVLVTTRSPNAEHFVSATSAATAALAEATPVSNTSAPTISGTAQDGQTLTAEPGSWSGSPTIVYTYQWELCNSSGLECAEIEAATGTTYRQTRADTSNTVRVSVTASNGAGPGTIASAVTGVVAEPDLPTNITPPTLEAFFEFFSGEHEFQVGHATEARAGSWTGDASVSYQWRRCDATKVDPETGGPVCKDIPGATEFQYAPRNADIGYELDVVETATNSAGSASAASEPSKQTVPLNNVEALGGTYTGAAVVGQTITADSGVVDPDELPITTDYEFSRVNGSEPTTLLQEGSDASYTPTSEDAGHEIKITMKVKVLRADEAISVASQTITLYTHTVEVPPANDTPPTITGATTAGTELTASEGSWHGGGGTLAYTYQWQRCDTVTAVCQDIASATEHSYTTGPQDVGSRIRVLVTATYEDVSAKAASARTASITGAEAPANVSEPTITGETTDLQALTATPGEWTGTAPIAYSYQWESCSPEGTECFPLPGARSTTYQLARNDVGTTLKVHVSASNGAGPVSTSSTATAVIAGAPAPVATSTPSITLLGTPKPGATISTDGGTWEHLELEPAGAELSYQWQSCSAEGTECEDISEGTGESYGVGGENSGHRLRVVVTGENETGRASSISSLSPEIGSEAPTTSQTIVYTHESTLNAANPQGGEAHELASCETVDPSASGCEFRHPSISADGEMIAAEVRASTFNECEEGVLCPKEDLASGGKIAVMNYDGTEARLLPGNGSQPTWSSDGTTLTYTRISTNPEGGQKASLYSINVAGSSGETPAPVPTGTTFSESATYSPDGNHIAFVGKQSAHEAWGLYVANSDGTHAIRMNLGVLTSADQPQFTAGGDKLIFDAVPPKGEYDPEAETRVELSLSSIYEINTDGTGIERLTHDEEENANPIRISESEIITTQAREVLSPHGLGSSFIIEAAHIHVIHIEEVEAEPELLPDDHEVGEVAAGPLAVAANSSPCHATTIGVNPLSETYTTGRGKSAKSNTEENVAVQTTSGSVKCRSGYTINLVHASLGVTNSGDTSPPASTTATRPPVTIIANYPYMTYPCVAGRRTYHLGMVYISVSPEEHAPQAYSNVPGETTMECNAAGAWRVRTYKLSGGRPPNVVLREELGEPPPLIKPEAHHIIPSYERKRSAANALEADGYACFLYPNATYNGVYLAQSEHRPIHKEQYWLWVAARLSGALRKNMACPKRRVAENLMHEIKRAIERGEYPGAPSFPETE
jgi:sugar lactone lactonase YvrE